MEFSYKGYTRLLDLIKEHNYHFCNYHDYPDHPRCVILRHDIDNQIDRALKMAEIESDKGVKSTYFVLLTTDFYNVASEKNRAMIKQMQSLGHEIGLHYDEASYGTEESEETNVSHILREARILSDIIETPVTTVSMHRPSRRTLDADLQIPGMINSYGKLFFKEFKYLSDSRRNWREPVMDIVKSEEFERLHILTHAFWYNEEEIDIGRTVREYILSANKERYASMLTNIRDLESIMKKEDAEK